MLKAAWHWARDCSIINDPLLRALKVRNGRLWGWASLFMGVQLGKMEWALLPGTLRYG